MIQASVTSRGVTLVELLVVLAVLGIMAAFVGLAWRPPQPRVDDSPLVLARQRAIESGIPVRFQVVLGPKTIAALALPDGSVIGADSLPIDPLSGAPHSTRTPAHD